MVEVDPILVLTGIAFIVYFFVVKKMVKRTYGESRRRENKYKG